MTERCEALSVGGETVTENDVLDRFSGMGVKLEEGSAYGLT